MFKLVMGTRLSARSCVAEIRPRFLAFHTNRHFTTSYMCVQLTSYILYIMWHLKAVKTFLDEIVPELGGFHLC